MGIGKYQIRTDPFPCDNVILWHSGKEPYLFSSLQGTCCLITYTFSKQTVRKTEGFFILDDFVTVCYHSKYLPVTVPYIYLVSLD